MEAQNKKKSNRKADMVLFGIIAVLAALLIWGVSALWI